MRHTIISKRRGWYTAFPQLYSLPDGRQAVGVPASPFSDHFHVDRRSQFLVFESRDDGESWHESDDPAIPYNWPGQNPRERYDRFADVMPDGSYLCAGSVGWQIWPVDRRGEAEETGLVVRPHQLDADSIVVGGHKMFVQRSTDGGRTWTRREWTISGFGAFQVHQVPQGSRLADGTILISCTAQDSDGHPSGSLVWRSDDDGKTFRMMPMGSHAAARHTNETSFLEVAPGRILSLSRTSPGIRSEHQGDPGGLVQRWSEDKGLTWTYPMDADFWGYPTHLLMLRDGRVLCSYGHRREPMGVRAVLSRGRRRDLGSGQHRRPAGRRRHPKRDAPRQVARGRRPRVPDLDSTRRRVYPHRLLHHRARRHHPRGILPLGGLARSPAQTNLRRAQQ